MVVVRCCCRIDLVTELVSPNYDEARYIASAVASSLGSSSTTLDRLTSLMTEIDEQIHHQVVTHHQPLLYQTAELANIDTKLQTVAAKIKGLQGNVKRIETGLMRPFHRMESHTTQLTNLQSSCDILRQCDRVLSLLERLKTQMKPITSTTAVVSSTTPTASDNKSDNKDDDKTGARDIVKAAETLSDIELVLSETDLTGITVIDHELPFITSSGQKIRQQGAKFLSKGMETLNQSEIGSALQVFYNLGNVELSTQVHAAVARVQKSLRESVQRMMDVATLADKKKPAKTTSTTGSGAGSARGPGMIVRPDVNTIGMGGNKDDAGNATTWRTKLWDKVDVLSEDISSYVLQVWTLQRVLEKKRDQLTNALFLDVLLLQDDERKRKAEVEAAQKRQKEKEKKTNATPPTSASGTAASGKKESKSLLAAPSAPSPSLRGDDEKGSTSDPSEPASLCESFWHDMTLMLTNEVEGSTRSNFVRQVFVNELPRLYNIFSGLFARLQATIVSPLNGTPLLGLNARVRLMRCFATFQQAYLTRTLSRLNDPINQMFPTNTPSKQVPSKSDVSSFTSAIHGSFDQVRDAPSELHVEIAKLVAKSVFFWTSKSENMMIIEPDPSLFPLSFASSTPHVSATQRSNSELFHRVCQVETELYIPNLRRRFPELSPDAEGLLNTAFTSLQNLGNEILVVLAKDLSSQFDSTLMGMHDEDFNRPSAINSEGSDCLIRLRQQAAYFVRNILPAYQTSTLDLNRQQAISKFLSRVSTSLVHTYIRVVTLLPPLVEQAKLKIAGDIAQLETILHAIIPKRKAELKHELTRFKDLLFANQDKRAELCEAKDVDRILMIQFLFSSCSLPKSAPHHVMSWRLDEYFRYIDTHTEAEVYSLFTQIYARVEAKIKIPRGPDGVNYVTKNYPELTLITKLIPRPS